MYIGGWVGELNPNREIVFVSCVRASERAMRGEVKLQLREAISLCSWGGAKQNVITPCGRPKRAKGCPGPFCL